jgi:lipoprotein-anchoring transpeptidase ErfK/SrfK
MTVTRNGKVIRTAPVSLGRSSYPTRSGVKVIMTREVSHRMRSETVGITGDDAYDIVVPYALRITYSGEFLHGAPWNGNIGSANTSHGCTNLRLSDAKWLYNSSLIGDPVITTGTRLQAESRGNGIGADWNVGWAKWVAGSALA